MTFAERLNAYLTQFGCTATQLAAASGVSASAISRYRAGERVPDPAGDNLRALARGLAELSSGTTSEEAIMNEFAATITGVGLDYTALISNLKTLLSCVGVSNSRLAHELSFDPSYISRVLAGRRKPADLVAFIDGAVGLVIRLTADGSHHEELEGLIGKWPKTGTDERARILRQWLKSSAPPERNPLTGFLAKLDAFDLEDFIRAIHFAEMKVPTSPLQLPTRKTYYGIDEMMTAEIDYLKATVLSKSTERVIMFSDMPLEDMAADEEFPKKWMQGMALMMKKGLHLDMIHNTARPLPEMMLGLESWIPLYMTGQVSPYYYEDLYNGVFCHHLKVSGSVALSGEAIAGYQDEGRYLLTKNREEVRYFRRRAERMREKARPLMRILRADAADELAAFWEADADKVGTRRILMSTLPIATIPPELLSRMLARNDIPDEARDEIRGFAQTRRNQLARTLSHSRVRVEVPALSRAEFEAHPLTLELAELFFENEVPYDFQDYAAHLTATRKLADATEGFELAEDADATFRNIQITVLSDAYAVVSKNAGPQIHFIIEHPAMVKAIQGFSAPIIESARE